MRIGVPTEIKNTENRVALTPSGAAELVHHGHEVLVQQGAGVGSSIADADYEAAGARLVATADEAWDTELLLKVKEPVGEELGRIRDGQTLFTYLHLAAAPETAHALIDAGATAIAYETVQLPSGALPLLRPMSEVAGRISVQVGAYHLMRAAGGRGILLGGVPGAPRANVVVIGGGVAGEHATANAIGLGADVTVVDRNLARLAELERQFDGRIHTRASNRTEIAALVEQADLVVGSVLIPGAAAPKLVTDDMVATMRAGSVLVDIAIDQGGCFEGSRPTTHADPTFPVHDAIYYCVANMPGAVPATSTVALTNATLPYVLQIADRGWQEALGADASLAKGLNVHAGRVVNPGVAQALGLELLPLEHALAA